MPMAVPSVSERFDLVVDDGARRWLDEHPRASRLFITGEQWADILFARPLGAASHRFREAIPT